MPDSNPKTASPANTVVDTTATSEELTLKQKSGDAANRWLARNRSLVLRQTPVWAQSLAVLLIGLGSIAVVGSIFFRIDEVITVQGQLKSIGGTTEVKTPVTGKVADVFFKNGEFVENGQLLMRFDTRQAEDDKGTLESLISIEQEQLKAQLLTIDSQVKTLKVRRDIMKKRLDTKATILNAMAALVEEGGFQRLQFLENKDQLFELEKQITDLQEQENRMKLQADQIQLQSRKSVDEMNNRLKQAQLKLQYQNILAPVSGIIFDPQAAKGGVFGSGERILSIVPQGGLYAEIYVPNTDIGYIKLEQKAKVRVDAFPFTRYGELLSSVKQIAADALPPSQEQPFYSFPVILKLDRSTLQFDDISIPLKPGMSISTNLKLRDKPVIGLISDIFVDQTDSVRSLRQQ